MRLILLVVVVQDGGTSRDLVREIDQVGFAMIGPLMFSRRDLNETFSVVVYVFLACESFDQSFVGCLQVCNTEEHSSCSYEHELHSGKEARAGWRVKS